MRQGNLNPKVREQKSGKFIKKRVPRSNCPGYIVYIYIYIYIKIYIYIYTRKNKKYESWNFHIFSISAVFIKNRVSDAVFDIKIGLIEQKASVPYHQTSISIIFSPFHKICKKKTVFHIFLFSTVFIENRLSDAVAEVLRAMGSRCLQKWPQCRSPDIYIYIYIKSLYVSVLECFECLYLIAICVCSHVYPLCLYVLEFLVWVVTNFHPRRKSCSLFWLQNVSTSSFVSEFVYFFQVFILFWFSWFSSMFFSNCSVILFQFREFGNYIVLVIFYGCFENSSSSLPSSSSSSSPSSSSAS